MKLKKLLIKNFTTEIGLQLDEVPLSCQLFGKELGTAPVVLVNHALTGNSNVSGKDGWWKELIGENKVINTAKFSVLAFQYSRKWFRRIYH